jgi:hypothetical protein
VYGGPGETHELAFTVTGLKVLEGDVKTLGSRGYSVLNFKADGTRKVARIGVTAPYTYVYMLGMYTRSWTKVLIANTSRPQRSL